VSSRRRSHGVPFAGSKDDAHKPEGHVYQRDQALPLWHGWHAFRRGLATILHALGVDDKTIQAILRHSNIGITQNIYIKSVTEEQVSAMDTLSEKLGSCNEFQRTGELRMRNILRIKGMNWRGWGGSNSRPKV
jgi:integrase